MLDRQNRALEHAHQQIKRSLESRLKLLDMVTHDLRSPSPPSSSRWTACAS